jgi:hypothetical protein
MVDGNAGVPAELHVYFRIGIHLEMSPKRRINQCCFACHDPGRSIDAGPRTGDRRRTTLASDNKIFAYEYNYVLVPDNSILNLAFG